MTVSSDQAMRYVLIMRHCATEWSSPCGTDKGRALAPRGREDACNMGRAMTDGGWTPDRVIASSAVRARTTAELAAEAGEWGTVIKIEESLYGATVDEAMAIVSQQPDDAGYLLVVGHEPCCSGLTNQLVGGDRVQFPTGGVACVEVEVPEWQAIETVHGRLEWFTSPK
ncbi:MAG: histidine phosphatase family protein [bacterium]|nr:histidine phosphatase family protein [bacterium]